MINVIYNREKIGYEVYHLVKAFFEGEEIRSGLDESAAAFVIAERDGEIIASVGSSDCAESASKQDIAVILYDQLSRLTGRELPWGILTGVRPTKLAMNALSTMDREAFAAVSMEARRVSREKADLSWDIASRENEIINKVFSRTKDSGFSLYVGIPVCPSICSYCSFSSGPLKVWKDSLDSYVEAIGQELSRISPYLKEMPLTSVYIGGGTPTVLNEAQLGTLLDIVGEQLNTADALEYTLEAGRPDTITEKKLSLALEHGVSRISINPQTMQQKTLDLVGREHSTADVVSAFALARSMGFNNINMDIIAGLPGEVPADMADTLEQISTLRPDSLTVHSLAIKRAASMDHQSVSGADINEMIDLSRAAAAGMQLNPYYLYRQKSIAGNHENVGYAREGCESIYNIMIMEEVQSIIAVGAGASSKFRLKEPIANFQRGGKIMTNILHQANVKSISEYISRANEMAEQKIQLLGYLSSGK